MCSPADAPVSSVLPAVSDGYAEYLAQHVTFSPGDTVLDLGCGDGRRLLALSDRIGWGIGVDIPDFVQEARRFAELIPAKNVVFYQDDLARLDTVKDESVDLVLCAALFERGVEAAAILPAVRRVLKPGGRFVCLTLNRHFQFVHLLASQTDTLVGQEEIERLLTVNGFHRMRVSTWNLLPPQTAHGPQQWTLHAAQRLSKWLRRPHLQSALFAEAYRPQQEITTTTRRASARRTVSGTTYRSFDTAHYDRARVL